MRVEVYWNLHKRTFSVRALEGVKKGRVVLHARNLELKNVSFVVQPSGNKKVRETGVKNVHAFIKGELVSIDMHGFRLPNSGVYVSYNPYRNKSFVYGGKQTPIHGADKVFLKTRVQSGYFGSKPIRYPVVKAVGMDAE